MTNGKHDCHLKIIIFYHFTPHLPPSKEIRKKIAQEGMLFSKYLISAGTLFV